jgi:hypothetical protein
MSRGSSRGSSRRSSSTTPPTSCVRVPQHVVRLVTRLVVDYFDYSTRPGALACRAARHAARRTARRRLLRLRRAYGCLGTSRGSSSTTSTTPRVRVPWHVARLITRRRAASRRLLRLRHMCRCLGMSRGSSLGSSRRSSLTTPPTSRVRVPRHVAWLVVEYFASCRLVVTTSPTPCIRVPRLVVDYFAYAARLGASARRAARRAAHLRLLRLRRASRCLDTSCGSSRGSSRRSSSTTSPPPRVRVPRHVARLVTRLVVYYSVHRDFLLRPHWLYFSHVVRRDYLSRGNTGSTSSTPRAAMTSSSGRIASTIHLN